MLDTYYVYRVQVESGYFNSHYRQDGNSFIYLSLIYG